MQEFKKVVFSGVQLGVEVSSSYPEGGDGSCTTIKLYDAGGFCFNQSFHQQSSATISCHGDLEFEALRKAIDFASRSMSKISKNAKVKK